MRTRKKNRVMNIMDAPKTSSEELNRCKKGNNIDQVDRISNLPDAIIHHILTFLSTVDVVRTSMLSRRWRHMWTEALNLNFDDKLFPIASKENAFANFVNGAQNLYKLMNIQKYCLSLQQPSNRNYGSIWVSFALERNVKELHVNMYCRRPFEMPFCISLKVLILNLQRGEVTMPISGCFSSLEILSLSMVEFTDDALMYVISQRCPRLKTLNLKECSGLNYLNISCLTLEELNIERCFDLNRLNIFAERLHMLSVLDSFSYESTTNSVMITAPSLQTFNWSSYIFSDVNIGKFTSLRAARISLVIDYYEEALKSYLRIARKFLSNLACAKSLTVEMPCFWGLSTQQKMIEGILTPLNNLRVLILLVGHDNYAFRGISYLFKSFSNLEILEIQTVSNEIEELLNNQFPDASLLDKREWPDYHKAPLNHLLEVKIDGFRGKDHEVEFVRFLLECAITLKKMIISFSNEAFANQELKDEIAQKLLQFTSTSTDVTVSFN